MLVGEAADFQEAPASGDAPEWEHTLLLKRQGSSSVAIDWLKTRRFRRFLLASRLDLIQIVRLAYRLRETGTVLAQSEERGYIAALAMALIPRRQKLFIIFHGQRWWTRRNRWLAMIVGKLGFVRFLCLSSALADHLKTIYRIPPDRIHTTGFGADDEFFQPNPLGGGQYIASAGSASRDYATLIEAGRDLGISIKIAADSTWYRESLDIDNVKTPANIDVFSCRDYKHLREIYSHSAFIVVPLKDVDFAAGYAVIAEAMAMGKAVIATRTRAPSDLIEDGVTGLYVPPGDAKALRCAITCLMSDPSLADRMGRAGRVAVERKHNVRNYVGRLLNAMGSSDNTCQL